jgi:hypothetical protein
VAPPLPVTVLVVGGNAAGTAGRAEPRGWLGQQGRAECRGWAWATSQEQGCGGEAQVRRRELAHERERPELASSK